MNVYGNPAVGASMGGGFNMMNSFMGMLPGLGQMAGSLFGNKSKAPGMIDAGFNQAMGYMNPFINMGQNAAGQYGAESERLMGLSGPLREQLMRMMQDPSSLMKSIGSGYTQSPGYKYNVDEATKAMNAASATGGMLGTPAHQKNIAETVSGLAAQDYNNYMSNALGVMNQGLGGAQNMFSQGFGGMGNMANMGFNAASNAAQMAQQNAMQKAQLEHALSQQRRSGFMGGLGSLLGGAAGFAFGGPGGAMIGSGLLR